MAAFKRAMVLGADGIELDVRLTRDGVPVVIHDASLRRTGLREGAIARITSTELADVDVRKSGLPKPADYLAVRMFPLEAGRVPTVRGAR